MLPDQEFGDLDLDVPFSGLVTDGRTRDHLPTEGDRQEQDEDEPLKPGKRFHAATREKISRRAPSTVTATIKASMIELVTRSPHVL